MECAQCGTDLQDGQQNCASCGAPVARQGTTDSDEEIHRLLAEANLLRIRKQLDEAVSLCTRVLRLDPANATAHSLMGDIYRDEENYRESLGWYKLAVQLNPANQADRKKLDEMIDLVFQDVRQADAKELPSNDKAQAIAMPASPTTHIGDTVRKILEKITPMQVIIGSTVLAVVAVICIFSFSKPRSTDHVQRARTDQSSTNNTTSDSASGDQVTTVTPPDAQSPQIIAPPPDTIEGTKIPGLPIIVKNGSNKQQTMPQTDTNNVQQPAPARAGAAGSAPSSVVQVPPFDPRPRSRLSAEELDKETNQLRAALVRSLKESKLPSTLIDVRIDPRSKEVSIDYNVPHMQGPVETKQGLLYTGFYLIWEADKSDSTLRKYMLRGYAYPSSPSEGEAPTLALQADVTPQQADQASEAGDYKSVAKCMSNVWWRGDLDQAQL